MTLLPSLLLGCAGCALLMLGLGVWATIRRTRRIARSVPDSELPPISLLKPLKGLEESLEANLRTFFEQDYPAALEIVFATTEADDEALPLARRLAAEYPEIPTRFVLSDASFGLNPKVANLAGALRVASHPIVLQSDANVRVRRDYLRRVVGELEAEGADLLTSLVAGVEERSVGAAMENLQLTAFISPAMCTALEVASIRCVVGKSMLFRREALAAVGGLESVRDILAEDFVLGDRFDAAGLKVILSLTTVENVNQHTSIEAFFARHSRWLKMRAVIHLGGFVGDLFANPVALGVGAVLVSDFEPRVMLALGAIALLKMGLDVFFVRRIRGVPMHLGHHLLGPIKDALMGAAWIYSAFSRTVTWRGVRLRLGAQSRLRPDNGALPIRLARRLLRV